MLTILPKLGKDCLCVLNFFKLKNNPFPISGRGFAFTLEMLWPKLAIN